MWQFIKATLFLPVRTALAFLKPLTDAIDMALRRMINKLLAKTGIGANTGFFDSYFADNADPLLRGDLLATAERDWPKAKHPTFYRIIPEDLRRPIIVDGRIRGSSVLPIDVFPAASITDELVAKSKAVAGWIGVKWFVVALVLGLGAAWFVAFAPLFTAFELPGWERPKGVDFWSADEYAWQQKVDQAIAAAMYLGQLLAVLTISLFITTWTASVFALTLSFNVFWANWRKLIFKAADANADKIRQESKEATVRWKQRFELRELEEKAYLSQLNEVDRLKSPTIEIGEATGVFAFRGSLSGPRQKTKIKMALEDAFQNTIVLGGTGSGKTFAAIVPMAAQLIALQDQRDISLYVTDSKGVLWKDIAEIATKMGKEYQVIGVGKNEVGIDLLDGLEPGFAADVIKSVMRQMGGTAGDSFWPDLAHNMCLHTLKVLKAWEFTDGGVEFVKRTGERPYSLVHLYETAMDAKDTSKDSMVARIEEDIASTIEKDPKLLGHISRVDLFASLRYLRVIWPNMAADTRSGIEANITNALGLFVSNVDLRSKFASGENSDITIDDLWGRKITLVNLPTSLGNAGRIVNVMLKSLLFNRALERQAVDPDIREKEQLAFLADEYQSLITADLNSAFTDTSFPNVARSTGMFYFVATQGIKALQQAVGEDSALNFINNMRNKIFLQIEEQATMSFSQQLAGKTMRFLTYDHADHESSESMRRELGYEPSLLGEAVLTAKIENGAGLWSLMSLWQQYKFTEIKKKFDSDKFSGTIADAIRGNSGAQRNWKEREDKHTSWMQAGNEMQDVLSTSDLMQMGRTHAYMCISRGGHLRQDIIELQGVKTLMPHIFA